MLISAFITHKKAEHFTDCQDRFSINPDTKSIALSDGMSQSIFQKYWAEILVDTYTSRSDWCPNLSSIRELSPIWRKKVDEYIENQRRDGKPTWRVERNLMDGVSAGATLLGIRFNGLEWKCDVLGDSCLILIHNNRIEKIFSSEEGVSFSNFPDYYDSNPKKEGKGELKTFTNKFESGDTILLVSDPFADFLLRNKGKSDEIILIKKLLSLDSHTEFEKMVEEWRNIGMRNDDSTLIIIKPDCSEELKVVYEDSIKTLIETEQLSLVTTPVDSSISEFIICEQTEVKVPLNVDITEENVINEKETLDLENSFEQLVEKQLFDFLSKDVLKLNKPKKIARHRAKIEIYIRRIIEIVSKSHFK